MKSISTHLLALVLGMAVVILWPRSETKISGGPSNPDPEPRPRKSSPGMQQKQRSSSGKFRQMLTTREMNREIAKSDLDTWIESMGDNASAKGQALAIAGLMLDDPELIRQGIAADPHNPHTLFIGANFTNFDADEKLALRKRLMEADPNNALAAYMTASQLMADGNQQEAMNLLKDSAQRSQMDDFGTKTQLLMEEAYLAAGLSAQAASIRSTFEYGVPHLLEMKSLTKDMKSMHSAMAPEEVIESRRIAATMGYRLSNQSTPNNIVNQLMGVSLELSTLEGLPDDAPSSYHGLNVGEARSNIMAEKERLTQAANNFGDHQDRLMSDPDLMQRYIQRFRLTGEMEALQWLQRTLDAGE